MTRRTGTSLIEVLVTVGILGIGLTSVIAMFPMAAITMGQALKDDRTATAAVTGDGLIRDMHWRNVVEPPAPLEPYFYAMDGVTMTGAPFPGLQPLAADGNPSYPVFVDPMGIVAGRGSVGDAGTPAASTSAIPRVTLKVVSDQPPGNQSSLALRLCSQMDGLSFDEDGNVPQPPSFEKRELRYNWLWVVQRPVNRDRLSTTLRVVVFDKRVHLYRPPGFETVFQTAFIPGQTSVTVAGTTAEVRKGSWVMDGTIGTDPAGRPIRHANFYRVLSVTTDINNNYVLELHTPIARLDGRTEPYGGNLVVMPAVADVYERPMVGGAGP